jgi:hypothetical protein
MILLLAVLATGAGCFVAGAVYEGTRKGGSIDLDTKLRLTLIRLNGQLERNVSARFGAGVDPDDSTTLRPYGDALCYAIAQLTDQTPEEVWEAARTDWFGPAS